MSHKQGVSTPASKELDLPVCLAGIGLEAQWEGKKALTYPGPSRCIEFSGQPLPHNSLAQNATCSFWQGTT
jgi:hypothetical protein